MRSIQRIALFGFLFSTFCMVQTAWADPEENKRLAREFYQNLWFNENTDRYADYLADEYVIHDTTPHEELTPAQILEMVRLQTAPEPADEPAGADSADVDDAETDLNLDDEDDVDVDEDDVDEDEDDGEFLWLDEEGADVPAEEEETEDEREVNDVERTSPSSGPGPGPSPGGRDELDAARGERATAAI